MGLEASLHPRVRVAAEIVVGAVGVGLLLVAARMGDEWLSLHATRAFCFDDSRQLTRWYVARAVVIVVGLLVAFVLRPIVGRWASRRSAWTLALEVVLMGIAPTVLALYVCERVLPPRKQPKLAHFEPDPDRDDRFGWKPKASHVTVVQVGPRPVTFVIDAQGERVASEGAEVAPDRPTILFTGESIASGFGLPWDETYASMVGEMLHVQPVNVAVQGYAVDASYLRLADALPRFSRLLATVTLVLPEMIERTVAPDRPHLLLQPDGTWLTEPRSDQDTVERSRVWALLRDGAGLHATEALRRARDVMFATARDSRTHGAVPLVVVFDWPRCLNDATGAPSIDAPLFAGVDVAHVHVTVPKAEWDPVTAHPDATGQRRIAQAIVDTLAARGVGVAAP